MTDTAGPLHDRLRMLDEIKAKVAAQQAESGNDLLIFDDIEDVHVSILAAYKAVQTVRVLDGATRIERVGQIALTRGPRPSFLLVEPKWKGGKPYPLGHNDVVVARRDPKTGWVTIAKVEDHNGSEVV
jgi:hypothetical protein